jgi:hypothetical protein
MTKFSDQLYDDLMHDHGRALADTQAPVARRSLASHRVAMTVGAGGLAVAATAGSLVALSGAPAYALTGNSDGTQTLAVYQQAGIAQANAKFQQLKEPVAVVPVGSGCPSISSLPKPVPTKIHNRIAIRIDARGKALIKVNAGNVPAGDLLVIAVSKSGQEAAAVMTQGKAPSCVSLPTPPSGNSGSGNTGNTGSGPSVSSNTGSGQTTSG